MKTGIYAAGIFARMQPKKIGDTPTTIRISREIRDELRAQKRGGESYDQLIEKMIRQYNPTEGENR